MRPVLPLAFCALATACALPDTPPIGPWGVRTLPAGDHDWQVRWQGEGPVQVDGRPVTAAGLLTLDGHRAHAITVGDLNFTVPARPQSCAPLRFLVLSDGRAAVDHVGPSAYWPGLLAEGLAREPAFILNSGDLVKRGADAAEWSRYLQTLPPWPPIVAVRGNHDRGPHFFPLGLAPAPVFAWPLGPLSFVGFDTELPDDALPAALEELDAVLTRAKGRWRVLALHRPVWSTGHHGSDERRLNDRLVPIIDRHQVDLVIAGHDHNYERFCPSIGVGPTRRCVAPGEGTVYVVSGGAATFTNPVQGFAHQADPAVTAVDAQASRKYSGANHFLEVDLRGDKMILTAHRTRVGNVLPPGVFDRVVLPARRPSGCAP